MKAWVVKYETGKCSHMTVYAKDQCIGVGAGCRMGPDVKLETSRKILNPNNLPTCKVCLGLTWLPLMISGVPKKQAEKISGKKLWKGKI